MERYINAEHFDERVRLAVGLEGDNMTDDFKDGIQATLMLLKTEPTADVVSREEYDELKRENEFLKRMQRSLTQNMSNQKLGLIVKENL